MSGHIRCIVESSYIFSIMHWHRFNSDSTSRFKITTSAAYLSFDCLSIEKVKGCQTNSELKLCPPHLFISDNSVIVQPLGLSPKW